MTLHLQTERGEHRQEWVVPLPVSTAEDVRLAAGRLLAQMRLTTLTTPSQWPRSARQKRRSALSEQWQGVRL